MNISTFISCKDHGQYLAKAIDSVLSQTVAPHELILIDDGSKDNSYDVMRRYGDRAKLIYHPVCKGNIASYNEGIDQCTGDVIHLMAADDYLLSNDIYAQCLEYLKDDKVGFCSVGIAHVGASGESLGTYALPLFDGVVEPKIMIEAMYRVGNYINGGCTLIKSKAQHEVGPYDSTLPYSADFANWVRVIGKGWHGAFIQKPLYAYRQHPLSMTHTKGAPSDERHRCAMEVKKVMEQYGL